MTNEIQQAARESQPKRKATARQREAGRNNLLAFNRSRARLTHGLKALISTGEVPPVPGADDAAKRVDDLLGEIVSDLGGPDQITGGRKAVLASLRLALLVLEIGGLFIAKRGLLDKKGNPHPLLHIMNTYGNSARHAALALGLERQPKRIETLDDVLADIAEKRTQTAPTDAQRATDSPIAKDCAESREALESHA